MSAPSIRPGRLSDAADLAALVDIAGEGLPCHFWSDLAEVGQSPFEVGRARAQREEGAFSFRNAAVAELDGAVAGALVGYPLDDPYELGDVGSLNPIVQPLVRLEAEAPGHWYVNVLAVYPEFRGCGLGSELLRVADDIGRAGGTRGMAIIVASENEGAARLYGRAGYRLKSRQPLVAFPGYRRGGDWLLLTKPHS